RGSRCSRHCRRKGTSCGRRRRWRPDETCSGPVTLSSWWAADRPPGGDPAAGLLITSFMLQLRCGNPQRLNSRSFRGSEREPPAKLMAAEFSPRSSTNEKGRLRVQAALGLNSNQRLVARFNQFERI